MPAVKLPNILITGTPGTGKSLLCSKICERINLNWINVSEVAKENGFIDGEDEELECPILDEDKLLDHMEPIMSNGGNIVEYHSCDFFPQRWFNAVYVITCNNTILFDRLTERNYNSKKIQSNIDCEIFQTILDEAKDSYDESIIFALKSETEEDIRENVKKVKQYYDNYLKKQSKK